MSGQTDLMLKDLLERMLKQEGADRVEQDALMELAKRVKDMAQGAAGNAKERKTQGQQAGIMVIVERRDVEAAVRALPVQKAIGTWPTPERPIPGPVQRGAMPEPIPKPPITRPVQRGAMPEPMPKPTITCPNCGTPVPVEAVKCPSCGALLRR